MCRLYTRRIRFCTRTMGRTTGTGIGGGPCILLRGREVLITQDRITVGGVGGAVGVGGLGTVGKARDLGLVQELGEVVCLVQGEWEAGEWAEDG
jgi:hypothetical protein